MASAVVFSCSGMNEYELKTELREYDSPRMANISREFKTDQPGQKRKSARDTPVIRPILQSHLCARGVFGN